MSEPVVVVEREGNVLVVTLNRPEKKNALNCEVMCRLQGARGRAASASRR